MNNDNNTVSYDRRQLAEIRAIVAHEKFNDQFQIIGKDVSNEIC